MGVQAYDRYNETDNKKSEQPDAEKNSSIDAQSSSELNSQNKKSGQSPSGVTSGVFPDENAHFISHMSDDPLLSFTDPDPQVRQQAQYQQDEYNRAASELRQIDPGNQILNYWSDGTTAPTLEDIQAVNKAIQTAKSNQDWNNINSTIYGNNSSGMNVVILHSGNFSGDGTAVNRDNIQSGVNIGGNGSSTGSGSANGSGGNNRFISDFGGNTIDLDYMQSLQPVSVESVAFKAQRNKSDFNTYGEPNTYVNGGNGHVIVYGPNGKALYDVSKSRVKIMVYNVNPFTGMESRKQNGPKAFVGSLPESVMKKLGL